MNITGIARPGRLRLIVAAVIVAMAALVIPLSQIASASTAGAAPSATDYWHPRSATLVCPRIAPFRFATFGRYGGMAGVGRTAISIYENALGRL